MKKFVVILISMVSVFSYSCNRDEAHVSAWFCGYPNLVFMKIIVY